MNAQPNTLEPEQEGPITERTQRILTAIATIDRKVDVIIAEREGWRSALYRIITSAISLLFEREEKRKTEKRDNMQNNSSRQR